MSFWGWSDLFIFPTDLLARIINTGFCIDAIRFYFLYKKSIDFTERGREGEKHQCERQTLIVCLLHNPWLGTKPATQACVLTGNRTSNLLLCGMTPTTDSHWSGPLLITLNIKINIIRIKTGQSRRNFCPGLEQGAAPYASYANLWQVLSPPGCLDLGSQIFSRGLKSFGYLLVFHWLTIAGAGGSQGNRGKKERKLSALKKHRADVPVVLACKITHVGSI